MWGDLALAVNEEFMKVDKEKHVIAVLTSTKVTTYQSMFPQNLIMLILFLGINIHDLFLISRVFNIFYDIAK